MPHFQVEIARTLVPADEVALLEAVHGALVDAFKIPAKDRTGRLLVHEPHRLATSPTSQQPELATIVVIDAFTGRSLDAKRALFAGIVERLEALGVPRAEVSILLRESPRENWGIRGGQSAADLDLGFTVEV